MKIAIIETAPYSVNPIDAHVRNAMALHEFLKRFYETDLLFSNKQIELKKYDIIIFSYASFYFDFNKFQTLIDLQDESCKYGWLTNEYNLSPNSWFKKKLQFTIANFQKDKDKGTKDYFMCNLNTLLAEPRNPKVPKKYDLIYYGTYRPNRERYFKKYLKGDLILSTSTKNQKKYKVLGCTSKVTSKISWAKGRETLNAFKASLYIEDEFTHDCFNHFANRFYEAIRTNTALFFDKSCQGTIDKENYQIDPFWIVDSYEEMVEKLQSKQFEKKKEAFLVKNEIIALKEKNIVLNNIMRFLESIYNG